MLSIGNLLIDAAVVLGAAQVGAAAPATGATQGLSSEQVQQALSQCGERRFESVAEASVNGQKRRARIQLCAKPADTDEQWAVTLEKAAAQIASSPQVSAESKEKLRGEFASAIAKARSGLAGVSRIPGVGDGASLPSIAALPRSATTERRPVTPPLAAQDRLVSNVPPLPAPLPPRAATASTGAVSLLAQPQLSFRCLASGETGDGAECDELRNNTTLLVQAEENLAKPATLRFVRRGDALADRQLGAMRKGQVMRVRVPPDVCKGIVRSELEVSTVVTDPRTRSEQLGRTLGPLPLRC